VPGGPHSNMTLRAGLQSSLAGHSPFRGAADLNTNMSHRFSARNTYREAMRKEEGEGEVTNLSINLLRTQQLRETHCIKDEKAMWGSHLGEGLGGVLVHPQQGGRALRPRLLWDDRSFEPAGDGKS